MPSVLRRRLYRTSKPPVGSRVDWGRPLARGLVAAYPCSENGGLRLADLTGAGPAAVSSAGVSWAPGRFGPALSLNGTSGSASVGHRGALSCLTGCTVVCWVKASTYNANVTPLVHKNGNGASIPYNLRLNFNFLEFQFVDSGFTGYTAQADISALSTGVWHQFAGTRASNKDLSVYVDGVLQAGPTSAAGTVADNAGSLYLGQRGDNNNYYAGSLDLVLVYNRALSATELLQLYREPLACAVPPAPHQRWWVLAGGAPPGAVLAGNSAATSTVAATTLVEAQPLSGASAASATVAATRLTEDQPLAGAVAATATVAGSSLTEDQPLAGSIAAAASLAATTLVEDQPLAGAVAGTASATGTTLTEDQPLAGSTAGTAAVAGNLAPPPGALEGAIVLTTAVAATTLMLSHALGGASAAQAGVVATGLLLAHALAGGMLGTSVVTGTLAGAALPLVTAGAGSTRAVLGGQASGATLGGTSSEAELGSRT